MPEAPERVAQKLAHLPETPGVYLWKDAAGAVASTTVAMPNPVYIGLCVTSHNAAATMCACDSFSSTAELRVMISERQSSSLSLKPEIVLNHG